jgi:protein disulfide-isomerase A6
MAADFEEAASTFTNVTFGGVECNVHQDVCNAHNVTGYPTIRLFLAGDKVGTEFKGDRTVDGFCDFVENGTSIKAKRLPKVTVDLHPLNFEDVVKATPCLFVTFYAPWCGHCRRFLPEARQAARAFLPDGPNVTFGQVNCADYREFCQNFTVSYPTITLFVNGVNQSFEGERDLAGVTNFVNAQCGLSRGTDGLLLDTAGVIPEASAVAQQFVAADDKSGFLERMQSIPGAEYYVKVVERFLAKGAEQVKKDMAVMQGILAARKGSWASLDGMKKRYNVFAQFFQNATQTQPPSSDL